MSLEEFFPHLLVDRADALWLGEEASAVFSPCRTYRYALTRRWDDGPLAAWLMCNPSTADAFMADPTVRRCMGFSKAWMCGGLIVLNLFGLRSTDPKALRTHPDPVGPDNDLVVSWHLSGDGPTIGPVIAAWGVNGRLNGRNTQMMQLLADHGQRVQCLVRTSAGHPGHPLYVPGDTVPEPYTLDRAARVPLSVPAAPETGWVEPVSPVAGGGASATHRQSSTPVSAAEGPSAPCTPAGADGHQTPADSPGGGR